MIFNLPTPFHCFIPGTITSLAFAPTGDLYIVEETSSGLHKVLELTPSERIKHFAGASLQDCGCSPSATCSCGRDKVHISTRLLLRAASDITVTPDGIVHIADQEALQVYSLSHYLPSDDQNGDYQVRIWNSYRTCAPCRFLLPCFQHTYLLLILYDNHCCVIAFDSCRSFRESNTYVCLINFRLYKLHETVLFYR